MLAKIFGASATATGNKSGAKSANSEQEADANSAANPNANANACEFLVINSGFKEKPLGDEDWILVEMLIGKANFLCLSSKCLSVRRIFFLFGRDANR